MSVTINGTNGLTFNDNSTQTTAATGFGFKNRIINGDMRIDQRNAGAAVTLSVGAFPYTLDRWQAFATGANVTLQQVASGITGIPNVLQITGAASNTAVNVFQKIEAKNIADLAGSTVTLSALLSNSLNTTVTWRASFANSADNFASVTDIATGTFTVNSTLTQYSVQIALPSGAANGVQILFSCANQTSGTFRVTNVQLEKGSTATSFDYRPYGTELQLCQRYYQKLDELKTISGTNGRIFLFPAQVALRAVPSISSGSIYNTESGVTTIASPTYSGINTNGGAFTAQTTAGGAAIMSTVNGPAWSAEL